MTDYQYAGYLSGQYATSLAEFGTPRYLPKSDGWILQRPITDTHNHDAIGCYPLFCCHDWHDLQTDLSNVHDLVSLGIVTDPFGNYEESTLRETFHHVLFPYKQHFIIDLSADPAAFISKHHQRNIRKAEAHIQVHREAHPQQYLADWIQLYSNLIQRHQITGMAAFSPGSFQMQFDVPGFVMFRATHDKQTVGMMLWYVQNTVAYYHLGAYSDLGYDLRASYALIKSAIDYFKACRLMWISLGAGAGTTNDGDGGLNRFKKGWATETRPVGFCGYIFDQQRYQQLIAERQISVSTAFFPKYRATKS